MGSTSVLIQIILSLHLESEGLVNTSPHLSRGLDIPACIFGWPEEGYINMT